MRFFYLALSAASAIKLSFVDSSKSGELAAAKKIDEAKADAEAMCKGKDAFWDGKNCQSLNPADKKD